MIYFDNGATTFPKPKSVVNAVNYAITKIGANPGRGGHNMAIKPQMYFLNAETMRQNSLILKIQKMLLSQIIAQQHLILL